MAIAHWLTQWRKQARVTPLHAVNRLAFVINIILLGLAPLLALLAILAQGGWAAYNALPWWGLALTISWAFSINMWMLLGVLAEHPDRRLQGLFFSLSNFALPLAVGVICHDGWRQILLEIATYHFTVLGLISGLMFTAGPLLAYRQDQDIKGALSAFGVGLAIFGIFLTLPALACEAYLLGHSDLGETQELIWLGLRYLGMLADLFILFPILAAETA